MPNELNYFSEMVVLNLYYNKLTGDIPDLSYLAKLEQLDLDANALSGTVPESLFNLPSLGKFNKSSTLLYFLKGVWLWEKRQRRVNRLRAEGCVEYIFSYHFLLLHMRLSPDGKQRISFCCSTRV